MMGTFPGVLNFNRLFLKLNQSSVTTLNNLIIGVYVSFLESTLIFMMRIIMGHANSQPTLNL